MAVTVFADGPPKFAVATPGAQSHHLLLRRIQSATERLRDLFLPGGQNMRPNNLISSSSTDGQNGLGSNDRF